METFTEQTAKGKTRVEWRSVNVCVEKGALILNFFDKVENPDPVMAANFKSKTH
jgi:hypothetical protein